MKKRSKIVFFIITVLALVIIINLKFYNSTGKNVTAFIKDYYFPKAVNIDEIYEIKEYKTSDQILKVEDYTFKMDQYHLDNSRKEGECRIEVQKSDTDMRNIDIKEDYFFVNFGESLKFSFNVWTLDVNPQTVGTIDTRVKTIKTKDKMYIYYKFYSDDGLKFDGKVYLTDSQADDVADGNSPKNQVGYFDLNN